MDNNTKTFEFKLVDTDLGTGKELYHSILEKVGIIPKDVKLELRGEMENVRNPGIDPSVLVAIVTSIASLLTSLLAYASSKKPKGQIVIKDINGQRYEVPVGTSEEELRKIVSIIEEFKEPRITIS